MSKKLKEKIERKIYCLKSDIDYWMTEAKIFGNEEKMYERMQNRRYAIQVLEELLK